MEYVIIDDNEVFAESLSLHFKKLNCKSDFYSGSGESLKSLAERFEGAKNSSNKGEKINISENDVIFININLKANGKTRLDQAGIKLLIWLRIKGVMNHCVLYSFETLYELLHRKPEHLIATSKGTTYVQLPSDFGNIEEILEKKKSENNFTAHKENVKNALKPAFNIEEIRHQEANWWGIVQLCDVHRNLFPDELNFGDSDTAKRKFYPADIDKKLEILRNRQALYLYEKSVDFKREVNNVLIGRLKKERENKRREIEKLRTQVKVTGKNNPRRHEWADFIEDRKKIIEKNKHKRDWRKKTLPEIKTQIEETKEDLEDGLELYQSKKEELKEIEKRIDQTTGRHIGTETDKSTISGLRHTIKKKKPSILYIDDQAHQGWSEIFQTIIYGKREHNSFHTYSNTDVSTIDLYLNVKGIINREDPDLILLDLRLKNEEGTRLDVENLSGAVILKKIRADFPGLPVLIVTASNKSWTYKTLQKLGCDAYWTKEGLDTEMEAENSAHNYVRFLELIDIMSNDQYGYLKKVSNQISKLQAKSSHWWEQPDWPNLNQDEYRRFLNVDTETVFDILEDSILILRDYLRIVVINSIYGSPQNAWLYPSILIQHLTKIVELIHGVENNRPSTRFIKYNRKDIFAGRLLALRGEASHYHDSVNLTFDSLTSFADTLLKYLRKRPEFPSEIKK